MRVKPTEEPAETEVTQGAHCFLGPPPRDEHEEKAMRDREAKLLNTAFEIVDGIGFRHRHAMQNGDFDRAILECQLFGQWFDRLAGGEWDE